MVWSLGENPSGTWRKQHLKKQTAASHIPQAIPSTWILAAAVWRTEAKRILNNYDTGPKGCSGCVCVFEITSINSHVFQLIELKPREIKIQGKMFQLK